MSNFAQRQTSVFPFYHIDHHSWLQVEGKLFRDCMPEIEMHMIYSIAGDDVELLQMLVLDAEMRLTYSRIIAVGTTDHLYAHIRYVAERAFALDAYGVLLAHNHTSGNTHPSWDDIAYTSALHHAFHKLDIALIDHMIVGYDHIFSLRRNGLLF